ncbi:MAG: YifB family Mg chelatase-like AAA ATPase [Gammaproteobacteria bacterium]|nr:YifB family Mg chelatase-like AAA ATPase [Gammaproteobacteria bacterium]
MSLAIVHTRAANGIEAPRVSVEVHISNGLPALSLVGLPEAAVKESKDRVRAALINSQFEFPLKRVTISLAPADLPKEGGRFDLPIALGILAASGQLPLEALQGYEFVGELALGGELRAVKGVLPFALQASRENQAVIIPQSNAAEAALISDAEIYAASHLLQVCAHLNRHQPLARQPATTPIMTMNLPDLNEVRGQQHAKRALEIAAAGRHSLLMVGPPGTGKSMLASRLPSILPSMSEQEALESAALLSISDQGFDSARWRCRTFRSPHHTCSAVALAGGGSHPRPGEISLSHHGVLFLDELPEFDRKVLEVLREPLESKRVTISRATRRAEFPADFQLVAAMNPCPCGYLGDADGRCRCTPEQVARYRHKISGPLLDRIDLQLEVPRLPKELLRPQTGTADTEASQTVQLRVEHAHQRQVARSGKTNAQLSNQEIERHCRLTASDQLLLENALERLKLSVRAYHRILKVARTIADLADSDAIQTAHLLEAISYRRYDRGRSH